MQGDTFSQLTCLVTYWSESAGQYIQQVYHFLSTKKSARQDYFFALDVILRKINDLDNFQPKRVIKICDGCASENRSSHVLSHLMKTTNHTIAYKVFSFNFRSSLTLLFKVSGHGKDKIDGQHGILIRWLQELNRMDLATSLSSAVEELNKLAKNQPKSDSTMFSQRFIYAIEEHLLPSIKDYPELKANSTIRN